MVSLQLDDINLANCHCITDAALMVLSRYEQSPLATADDISLVNLGAKDSGDNQLLIRAASDQFQEAPGDTIYNARATDTPQCYFVIIKRLPVHLPKGAG